MSALGVVHASDRWVCTPAPDHSGWQCASSDGSLLPQATNPPATSAPQRTVPAASLAPLKSPIHVLDWVPRDELPASKLAVIPEYCDGAYVEPSFAPMTKEEAAAAPIHARADQVQYYLQEHGELIGNVEVTRGNQSLIASKATLHEPQQSVTVDDGLTLREPGMLVDGKAGLFMIDTGAATITDAQFVLQPNDLRGTAQQLDRDADGNLKVVHASFTRCEPGNEKWKVTGSSVEVENGAKFGTARNAFLRVEDIPLLYTPYLRFPVTDERMTGWLFPSVGFGSSNGVDVAVPYYLNLAPNYDATLTPRFISKRGTDYEGEFRTLSPYGKSTIIGAFLPSDNEYNGQYSKTDFDNLQLPGPFKPADRWLFGVRQQATFDGFRTEINSTKVSDFDYFRDLGNGLASSSQVGLQQYASVSYANGAAGLATRVWVQDFQRLDTAVAEPYRRLPEIDLSYRSTRYGNASLAVDTSWASFDRPNDQFVGIARINGDRFDIDPTLRIPFDWVSGFVRFAGGYRYTAYNLEDVPVGSMQQPDRTIGFGSVDSGLYFERDTSFLGSTALQTLEPRVYYLYQQYKNQDDLPEFDTSQLAFTYDQLFRSDRFVGVDRIGDANQVAFGTTTRWLDGDTGRERWRASLGQIYYFEDRQVTLNGVQSPTDRTSLSPYVAEVIASAGEHFVFRGTTTFKDGDWDEIGAGAYYRFGNRHIFNLSYRRVADTNPPIRQSDVSWYWSVFRQWALIGRFDYDLNDHRTIEALGGLEYSDCCLQLRVIGRKYLSAPGSNVAPVVQSDEGVFFEIVFKGLAGFGGHVDSMMKSGITGYVPEEH